MAEENEPTAITKRVRDIGFYARPAMKELGLDEIVVLIDLNQHGNPTFHGTESVVGTLQIPIKLKEQFHPTAL
jgi:DNA-binding phage protein